MGEPLSGSYRRLFKDPTQIPQIIPLLQDRKSDFRVVAPGCSLVYTGLPHFYLVSVLFFVFFPDFIGYNPNSRQIITRSYLSIGRKAQKDRELTFPARQSCRQRFFSNRGVNQYLSLEIERLSIDKFRQSQTPSALLPVPISILSEIQCVEPSANAV